MEKTYWLIWPIPLPCSIAHSSMYFWCFYGHDFHLLGRSRFLHSLFPSSTESMQKKKTKKTQFYHLMLLPLIKSSQELIKAFSTCTFILFPGFVWYLCALSVKMYLLFLFLTGNPDPIGVVATDGFSLSLFHLEIKQNTFLSHLINIASEDTVSETSDMEPPAPFLQ